MLLGEAAIPANSCIYQAYKSTQFVFHVLVLLDYSRLHWYWNNDFIRGNTYLTCEATEWLWAHIKSSLWQSTTGLELLDYSLNYGCHRSPLSWRRIFVSVISICSMQHPVVLTQKSSCLVVPVMQILSYSVLPRCGFHMCLEMVCFYLSIQILQVAFPCNELQHNGAIGLWRNP